VPSAAMASQSLSLRHERDGQRFRPAPGMQVNAENNLGSRSVLE